MFGVDVKSLPYQLEIEELERKLHGARMLNNKEEYTQINKKLQNLCDKQRNEVLQAFKNLSLLPVESQKPQVAAECKACGDMFATEHTISIALCKGCLEVIGELKKKKESWWFKE